MRSARMSPLASALRPSKMPLATAGVSWNRLLTHGSCVRVEREGRGVDAAAAGRVGDHGAGRPVAASGRFRAGTAAFPASRWSARCARAACGSGSLFDADGSLAFSRVDQALHLADVLLAPPVVDRVVGRGDQPDRGDLAAAAAGAVSAGGGVVVVAIEHQPLGLAVGLGRAFEEAGGRVGRSAEELEARLQRLEQRRVLLALDQRVRPADFDAFEAAGALPRIDRRPNRARRCPGVAFSIGVEERPRPGDRERAQRVGELAEVARAARRCRRRAPSAAAATISWNGFGVLLAPIDLAHRVGRAHGPDRAAPRAAPRRCRADGSR